MTKINPLSEDNELIGFYYSLLENVIDADRGFQDVMMMEHGKDYQGLDDDMPDAFDEWMSERDMETILESYFRYLSDKQALKYKEKSESRKKSKKKYSQKHRKALNEYSKKYYILNKAEIKKKLAAYFQKNPEYQKAYQKKNKLTLQQYQKEYREKQKLKNVNHNTGGGEPTIFNP